MKDHTQSWIDAAMYGAANSEANRRMNTIQSPLAQAFMNHERMLRKRARRRHWIKVIFGTLFFWSLGFLGIIGVLS